MSRRTGHRSRTRDLLYASCIVVGLAMLGAAFLTTSQSGSRGLGTSAAAAVIGYAPDAESEPAGADPANAGEDAANEAADSESEEAESEEADEAALDSYGLPAERFEVVTRRVRRNETFGDLLGREGVSYPQIAALADSAADVFDARRIQAGKRYRIYRNPWLDRARYLVYEIDAQEYVVFDVRHPERTRKERREASVEWKTVGGTIRTSLWQTLVDQGAHPQLVLQMSEVFGWQVDFFRIQRGDSFRLVYEQRTIDGERVQPGAIIAGVFRHRGQTFYGFRFDEGDGPAEYFDREGRSLQRQLLKAPLRYSRISSHFSHRRFHPVLKKYRPHHGVDYAAPRGTPVRSVGDGVVLAADYRRYNGNYVKIRHNGIFTTGYLHLASIGSDIRPGATVEQGEIIGTVGSTGRSTGPHLDYRIWKRGKPVDPYTIELPPVRPVSPQHRETFEEHVDALMETLEPGPNLFAGEVPTNRTAS